MKRESLVVWALRSLHESESKARGCGGFVILGFARLWDRRTRRKLSIKAVVETIADFRVARSSPLFEGDIVSLMKFCREVSAGLKGRTYGAFECHKCRGVTENLNVHIGTSGGGEDDFLRKLHFSRFQISTPPATNCII